MRSREGVLDDAFGEFYGRGMTLCCVIVLACESALCGAWW